LQGVVRVSEKFFCSFEDYVTYPFDTPNFSFRFELSHFEYKNHIFRFDYFRQWMQEIYWSPRSDFMPEYVIDYDSVKFTTLVESKPFG
jgi:hypothetical protein